MKLVAIAAFLVGLLLAVRVMFFGVQRRLDESRLAHRVWPLALAAFLVTTGALLYGRTVFSAAVTVVWTVLVALLGVGAGLLVWWMVRRSAAIPSTGPEDDPRYRFQGHVARVTEPIETRGDGISAGRIAFNFDGRRYEYRARWTPGEWEQQRLLGVTESEVVIERVEGEVAYVEPWKVVEERL